MGAVVGNAGRGRALVASLHERRDRPATPPRTDQPEPEVCASYPQRATGPEPSPAPDSELNPEMCPRCGCCEIELIVCERCDGTGVFGHDCGEDCCCCVNPDENEPCYVCGGVGSWWVCGGRCDEYGKHTAQIVESEDA
jgi:hypothetical protein